jgi:hypothetical protein
MSDEERAPKVTLEFPIPECESELRTALDGWRWKNAVWQIDQWLRQNLKHGPMEEWIPGFGEPGRRVKLDEDTMEAVQAKIHLILEEEGLDLWRE